MSIELEILNASYWEHFKCAKDLALYLPLNHPRRVLIEKELNIILKQIKQLEQ